MLSSAEAVIKFGPMRKFPWGDLRKILPGCQQMAMVPYGIETLPKISIF